MASPSPSDSLEYEIRDNVLFVKGFTNDLTEKYLRLLFSMYGNIMKLQIQRKEDKAPVAFVHYDSVRAANNAIEALNGKRINQSPIWVSKARRRINKNDKTFESNNSFKIAEPIGNNSLSGFGDKSYGQIRRMTSVKNLSQLLNEKVDNYVSSATIEVLNEELLTEIFEYLTLKQKFRVQRVCHLWRSIIKTMIGSEPTLTFGRKPGLECTDILHLYDEYNDLTDALIQPNGKAVLKDFSLLAPIIRPMDSIECLQFADCFLQTIAFKWIITQSPNLKCLRLDNVEGIGRLDWPKLARPLSSKLIHFSFSGNKLNDWNSLSAMVASFVVLQQLIIGDCTQDLYKVFLNLSHSVIKLSIIRCERLNADSIRAMNRGNGPNIMYIEVDFALNSDCISTIEAMYCAFADLQHLRAINIRDDVITQLNHDITANTLSIVFSGLVDLRHPVLLWAESKGLESLEISGSILPKVFENFSNRFPICKVLKLIDCKIICECRLNRNSNCVQCFERFQRLIFIESTLSYVSLNGNEYDKEMKE